jgi:hypothetical protein
MAAGTRESELLPVREPDTGPGLGGAAFFDVAAPGLVVVPGDATHTFGVRLREEGEGRVRRRRWGGDLKLS